MAGVVLEAAVYSGRQHAHVRNPGLSRHARAKPIKLTIEAEVRCLFEFSGFNARVEVSPAQVTTKWQRGNPHRSISGAITRQGVTREVGHVTVLTQEEFARGR